MNKILLKGAFMLLAVMISYGSTNAQRIHLDWVKSSSAAGNYQNTTATTTDEEGNVYLTGFFSSSLKFGGDSLLKAIGNMDGFILKMDPAGKVLWIKQTGYSKANCQAFDVKTDRGGNVYVSGMFTATMDFNPGGGGTDTFVAVGNWDAYVCKYDASGNYLWSKKFGGSAYNLADYLAIDAHNNVYVSGFFQKEIDLDPGPGIDTVSAMGGTSYDRFLCRLDSMGNYKWGMHFQRGCNVGNIDGLAVDPSGNAYLVGSFFQTMDFPTRFGIPTLTAVSPYDMHLTKIDTSGRVVWSKRFGGNGDGDFGYAIAADDKYNLYITGTFNRTADLDPGTGIQNFTCKGGLSYYDIFVLKADSAGNYIWAQTFGSSSHDNGLGVAVDKAGNVYATGSFQDTINFVPGSNKPEDNIIAYGAYNIYAVKFDASGKYVWSASMGSPGTKPIGGTGENRGDCIAVDKSGSVYITGIFKDTVDFDPGPGKVELIAPAARTIFLLKLACNDTSSATLADSSCSSYTFNGETYNETGIYKHTFFNTAGCDSSVYLDLKIVPMEHPLITTDSFTLGTVGKYSTYQWMFNGNIIPNATEEEYTVTANGNYQVIVTNENGCTDTSDVYAVTNYQNVGLDDLPTLAKQVIVFPNPANNIVYIKSPAPVNITISSIDGKQLIQAEHADHIALHSLSQGIYFLKITDPEGQVIKVEKLMKQ